MDQPGAPRRPLDAERERLRKEGHTEAEISEILIKRAVGGPQHDAPGHSPMTGVASNLAAAGSYAKNFIPGLAANAATIFDTTASGVARSSAALSFAFKIIVVAVVAYVLYLELSQLRSTTERAAADATAADAEAHAKAGHPNFDFMPK